MVIERSRQLDDFILEIFEKEENLFHFPLASQKDARVFIKKLHKRGVAYETLCSEVNVKDENAFTLWRKSLGRMSIGNKVIDRINKPLQDLLFSDEELEQDEEHEGVDGVELTDENRTNAIQSNLKEISSSKQNLDSVNVLGCDCTVNCGNEKQVAEIVNENSFEIGYQMVANSNKNSGSMCFAQSCERNENDAELKAPFVLLSSSLSPSKCDMSPTENVLGLLVSNDGQEVTGGEELNSNSVRGCSGVISIENKAVKSVGCAVSIGCNNSYNTVSDSPTKWSVENLKKQREAGHINRNENKDTLADTNGLCCAEAVDPAPDHKIDEPISEPLDSTFHKTLPTKQTNGCESISHYNQSLNMISSDIEAPTADDMRMVEVCYDLCRQSMKSRVPLEEDTQAGGLEMKAHSNTRAPFNFTETLWPNQAPSETCHAREHAAIGEPIVDIEIINSAAIPLCLGIYPCETTECFQKPTVQSTQNLSIIEELPTGYDVINDIPTIEKMSNRHGEHLSQLDEKETGACIEDNNDIVEKPKYNIRREGLKVADVTSEINGRQKAKAFEKKFVMHQNNDNEKHMPANVKIVSNNANGLSKSAPLVTSRCTTLKDTNVNELPVYSTDDFEFIDSSPLLADDSYRHTADGIERRYKEMLVNDKQSQSTMADRCSSLVAESSLNSTAYFTPDHHLFNTPAGLMMSPNITETFEEGEVTESYNSEPDTDLQMSDHNSTCRNLWSDNREGSKDGCGYIYTFTDSSNDAVTHRIKVGSSRQPYKRLQQATLFNIDVKLVSAVVVRRRSTALHDVLKRLTSYKIVGSKDWFLGPLDDMLQIIMDTTRDYLIV